MEIVNVITAPEIEMLIICNEGKYLDFEKRKNMSPSEYCKSILKMKNVKSVSFVKEYFSDISVLEKSLYEYKKMCIRDSLCCRQNFGAYCGQRI